MAGYKLKNKSSAKKRFSFTGTGKIKIKHSKKRHNARKLSSRSNRDLRKSLIAEKGSPNRKIIIKYLLKD